MKKGTLKGLAIGIIGTTLIFSLTLSTLAVNRSITIDDGIKVTINGTDFVPKDANGNKVLVFTSNGVTYIPARAVSEALGFTVNYDSKTRTAAISTSNTAAPDAITSASINVDSKLYIGEAKAKEAALKHAKLSANTVTFAKVKLDAEKGNVVYDIEFYSGNNEYDYKINVMTGAIVSYDYDTNGTISGAQNAKYIGVEKAKSIALTKAAKATIIKCEFDYDDGKPKYDIELKDGSIKYDCEIDAIKGTILKWEID